MKVFAALSCILICGGCGKSPSTSAVDRKVEETTDEQPKQQTTAKTSTEAEVTTKVKAEIEATLSPGLALSQFEASWYPESDLNGVLKFQIKIVAQDDFAKIPHNKDLRSWPKPRANSNPAEEIEPSPETQRQVEALLQKRVLELTLRKGQQVASFGSVKAQRVGSLWRLTEPVYESFATLGSFGFAVSQIREPVIFIGSEEAAAYSKEWDALLAKTHKEAQMAFAERLKSRIGAAAHAVGDIRLALAQTETPKELQDIKRRQEDTARRLLEGILPVPEEVYLYDSRPLGYLRQLGAMAVPGRVLEDYPELTRLNELVESIKGLAPSTQSKHRELESNAERQSALEGLGLGESGVPLKKFR